MDEKNKERVGKEEGGDDEQVGHPGKRLEKCKRKENKREREHRSEKEVKKGTVRRQIG